MDSGVNNKTMQNNANLNFNASNASIADGGYTVRYYCWDGSDNFNGTANQGFSIDTIFPRVNITVPQNITYTNASFNFNVSLTEVGTVVFSLTNGAVNYTMGSTNNINFNYTNASIRDGSYALSVYANDSAGNRNDTTSVVFSIDAIAPAVTINVPANQTYTNSSFIFNVTLDENGTVLYSLNGGATNYSMSSSNGLNFNASNTSVGEGSFTFRVWANDSTGNRNDTTRTTFFVDTIKPLVQYVGPTDTNGTTLDRRWIIINVTATDANLANITINLYDSSFSLVNSTVKATSPNFVNITVASDGTYYFNATATDSSSNINYTQTRMVVVLTDSIAPIVIINHPQNTTLVSPIIFNVTLNESGICNYTLDSGVNNKTMQNNANLNFNASNASIADGGYTVNYCWDTANNLNSSTTRGFSVDNTPPLVTINLPSGNLSTSSVTFNITLNEAGDTAQYSLNGGATNTTMQKNGNTDFNATNASIADGNYVVNFYVNDSVGNFNRSSSRAFTVDTTRPSLSFVFPTQASGYYANRGLIEINVTASDTNLANITIRVYNSTQAINQTNVTTSSSFYINYTLGDGIYFYNVTALDTLNNKNETVTRNITLDTILPSASYGTLTESSGALLTRNNIVINITASDTNLANITIRLYNSTQAINQTNISTTSPFLVNYTGLADGVYFFNATVIDLANNQNNTLARTITIDTISPVVNITVPANITYTNASFNFNASLNENGIVIFSLTGGAVNYTMSSTNNRNFNFTNSSIRDGSYTFTVYSNDTAGNRNNTTSVFFSIDTLAPGINLTYLLNTTYTTTQTALNYTVSGASTCWYSTNGGSSNTTITCGTNVTGLSSAEGSNTWTVYANDTPGNRNSSSVTFFVDSLIPGIQYGTTTESNGSTLTRRWIIINVTATDTNLANITINLFNSTSLVNTTIKATSPNFVNISVLTDGTYYFNATVLDTLSNRNTTETRTVFVDTVQPLIGYGTGSDNDGINVSRSNIYVNVSVTEANEANITFSLSNTTGIVNSTTFSTSVRSMNWTSLADGNYTYNVTVSDTASNRNATSTRSIILDTINPLISYGTGTASNNTLSNRNWIYVNVSVTELNEANITFTLFNSTSLVNSTVFSTRQRSFNWTSLADGNYLYNVTLIDRAGNRNTTATQFITLDTTTLGVTINFPQNITYSSLPLNFNVSLSESGDRVAYSLTNGATNVSMSSGDNRNYNASNGSIADGSYTFKAYANDSAGNRNDTSSVVFSIDRTSPQISLVFPQNTTYTTTQTALNYTVSDPSLQACWYSLNLGVINTSVTCGTNVTSLSSSEGTNIWIIFTNDSAGNTNSSRVTFFVDSIKPIIQFVSPTPLSGTLINRNTMVVNVTASDTNLANITLRLYNTSSLVQSNVSAISPLTVNYTNLADGIYFFNATALDIFNNANTTETRNNTVNTTIDFTSPGVTITSPAAGAAYSSADLPLQFNITLDENGTVLYTLDEGSTNMTMSSLDNRNFNATSASLTDGGYTLRAYANDSSGNRNDTTTASFTVSTASVAQPSSGGGSSARVSSFSLDRDVLNVKLKQGETTREPITITNTGGDNQQFTITIQSLSSFIILTEESFSLAPGESKTIYADFFASEKEKADIHAGRIVVQGIEAKPINVIFEVQEKIALFDIRSEIQDSTLSRSLFSGQQLTAKIYMINIGDADKRVDVTLEYFIKDFAGNEIKLQEETLGVYGTLDVTRSFSLPHDLKEGDYLLSVKLTYGGSTAISADRFSIEKENSLASFLKIYGILPLLLIIVVVFTLRLGHSHVLTAYWKKAYRAYASEKRKISTLQARYMQGKYESGILTIEHFPKNFWGDIMQFIDGIHVKLLRLKYKLTLIRVNYKLGVYDEEIAAVKRFERNIMGMLLSVMYGFHTSYLRLKYKLILVKIKYQLGYYDNQVIPIKHMPQHVLGTLMTLGDLIYVRYLRLKYSIIMKLYPPQERVKKRKR
ncbi:Ig-like domain repeat protein [Candidatus Pacearchaeota archaeon]|nr:Ig-like domain repeat protein [Candidatus Pacearchaeota archaeon]